MPDREKVIKGLEVFNKNRICLPHLIPWDEITDAIAMLKEQEAVVRCKDCRYWLPMNSFHEDYHPGNGECELNRWVRQMDWFCADGERKEKEKSK